MNYSDYTGRVYRGHPGVERNARWYLLCLRVLTRGVWRDDFEIGDIVMFLPGTLTVWEIMCTLVIELGTNLRPRPD